MIVFDSELRPGLVAEFEMAVRKNGFLFPETIDRHWIFELRDDPDANLRRFAGDAFVCCIDAQTASPELHMPNRSHSVVRIDRRNQYYFLVRDGSCDRQRVERRRRHPLLVAGVFAPFGFGRGPRFVAAEIDPFLATGVAALSIQRSIFPKNIFAIPESEAHHASDFGNNDDLCLLAVQSDRVFPAVINDSFDCGWVFRDLFLVCKKSLSKKKRPPTQSPQ